MGTYGLIKMRLFYLVAAAFAEEPPKEAEANVQFGNLYNSVGWETLFHSISDPTQNAIISPLAIMGSIFMLAESADESSKAEIYDVFGANLDEGTDPLDAYHMVFDGINKEKWSNAYNLTVANGVFYHRNTELGEAFESDILNKFGAKLQGLDFAGDAEKATETINQWASETTNGMVSPLYPEPLKDTTAMVLASSIYFKSNWQDAFKPVDDHENDELCWVLDEEALLSDDGCLEGVKFMSVETDMYYKKDVNNKVEVIEVPFQFERNSGENNRIMFQIWMPNYFLTNDEDDAKFREYIKENVDTIRFDKTAKRQRMRKSSIKLTMPKFNVATTAELTESLKKQGIPKIFTQEADFTPIVGEELGRQVFISGADHAVNFKLDENGVEGAAVNAFRGEFRSLRMQQSVVIDRPFYFSISTRCYNNKLREDWKCPYENTPVFVGKIVNPFLE